MKHTMDYLAAVGLAAVLSGCGESSPAEKPEGAGETQMSPAEVPPEKQEEGDGEHEHEEESLGTIKMDGMDVKLAQGHGEVAPGKEGHLVVKLPYSDSGSTIVRAWIGTEDRTGSLVGKGTYAASHDDYDIHATAPTPLPENSMWWIEIEKPDGTKIVGSKKPLME